MTSKTFEVGFTFFETEDEFESEDLDMVDETSTIIRGKGIMDGAESIQEAIEMLEVYTQILQDMADRGFDLSEAVEDDYALLKMVD